MNKVLVFSAAIATSFLMLTACNKESDNSPNDEEKLFLSASVVKRGQMLTAVLGRWNSVAEWKVTPDDGIKIFADNNRTALLFTQPGHYIVTAKATHSSVSHTDTVRVVDTPYSPITPQYPSYLASNDIVTLEPMSFKDSVLVFYAHTKKSYSCLTTLLYVNASTPAEIKLDILGTPNSSTVQCIPGPYPPPSNTVYVRGYTRGTYNITIRVGEGQVAYVGRLTVTDDKYLFDWPDNIPVVITPKQIGR